MTCDRVEREGLLHKERGQELSEHFTRCEDCRSRLAEYDRLAEMLFHIGEPKPLPSDWMTRVKMSIISKPNSSFWRRPVWVTAITAAAAVVLWFAVWQWPDMQDIGEPRLEWVLAADPKVAVRSTELHPGAQIVIRAILTTAPNAELRIYLNSEELILRCPGSPACKRRGRLLSAQITLPSVGTYQAILLHSDKPIPYPSANLDEDTSAALSAGASLTMQDLEVR